MSMALDTMEPDNRAEEGGGACQSCGACCAYSDTWPRFSLESDAEIAAIPEALIAANLGGMRCQDNRCLALAGEIGKWTGCSVYEVRPQVCRSCMPGDDACVIARRHFRLYEMPRPTPISPDPTA